MAASNISIREFADHPLDAAARAQAGEEIRIEDGDKPSLLLKSAPHPPPKESLLSAAIARLRALEQDRGYPARMDDDFAEDMRQIIANRQPRDTSAWD